MNPEDQNQIDNQPQQDPSLPKPTATQETPLVRSPQLLTPATPPNLRPFRQITPVVASPIGNQTDKNKFMVIVAIVAVVAIVAIIAVVLMVFVNSNKSDGQNKGNINNIATLSDVKNIDDAVAFAKEASDFNNQVMTRLLLMDDGTKKTYVVRVADMDGFKKDKVNYLQYKLPGKIIRFNSEGNKVISDTYSAVGLDAKEYIGYRDSKKIEEIFAKAKKELSILETQLGKTYVFEYNDTIWSKDDGWKLIWVKAGQNEKSNELQASYVYLSGANLDVNASGDDVIVLDSYDKYY